MEKPSKKKGKPPAIENTTFNKDLFSRKKEENNGREIGPIKAITIDIAPSKPKTSNSYLYGVMILNLLICTGHCFVFDVPQALEESLLRSLKIDTIKVSMLYSIYSLPNLIFSPITGYLIEKAGCNNSAVLYTTIIFIGQSIIYYGIYIENYWFVLAGRGVFGIGAEGITILNLTINELWFYGSYLSVGVALSEIFGILCVMLGNFFNPFLFSQTRNLPFVFFVCAVVCFFSFISAVFYYRHHNKYISKLEYHKSQSCDESVNESHQSKEESNTKGLILDPWITNQADISPRRKMTAEEIYNEEKLEFGFKSIKYFNGTYWILCICLLFLANCYYQFTNIATELLTVRYGYRFEEAKEITIAPEIAFVIVSPFVSKIIEVRGWKPLFILFSAILFSLTYTLMYFLESERSYLVYICFTSVGVCFSIVSCALFSSVALSIPKAGVSMGYSILTTIENIGLSSLPLYFGQLSQTRTAEAYNNCLLSLVVLSVGATLCSVLLLIHDNRKSQLLTLPENSKVVRKLRRKIDSDFVARSFADTSMAK